MVILQFLIAFLFQSTPTVGGELRDLAYFKSDQTALAILEDITVNPTKYLPKDVYRVVGYPDRKHQEKVVYGMQLDGKVLNISYLKNKVFYIRQIEMDNLEPISFRDLDVSTLEFTVDVGLVQRKLILTDSTHTVQLVFPLGVSAFDLGVSKRGFDELMTPRLTNAWLDPKRAVFAEKAHGYQDLPFLPLSKSNGEEMLYALHAVQHSFEDPNSKHKANFNYIVRAFDSHGCIRVRMHELYSLYFIVVQSKKVTVNTRYYLDNPLDSVYPFDDTYYNQVKNYGTVNYPQTRKAPAGYYVTETVKGVPPIWKLTE